ncbi:MAG: glucokinase [Thermoleophilaceae bacterium]|nr:glucokinase [Thermoleophilaceae bacterium]MEA2400600.1 glucokinase [Thermoleophilaceae bacterium]MEA2456264.1 glucokinase [Thermoleophilaceae bacterium]
MVLGVDVGGTKVAVAAVDGVSVREATEDRTSTDTTEALLDGIEAVVQRMIDGVGEPEAIGVGVPSQIEYETGTVETSVNIPLTGVPLREELGRRFGVPVFVDNDANCAALAEAHILGEDNLVMLTLGTGVGGGIVTGGMTFRGAHGLGAELGHMTLNPDGPPCPGNCPNRGCIEAYCSGQALERDATELARDKPDSQLATAIGANGKVSGPALVEAAEAGDGDALLIFDNFARMLGVAIAGYVNVFEPDRLTIGGGLSRASHLFLDRAVQEANARALPALLRRTTIALAEGGADAGVIGAAVLAAQEVAAQKLRDTPMPHATTTERAE